MRGMRAPEGRRALARPDKLAARASPAETFFGRGRLPPRAPGILRFCSTLEVSVFHHLTAATAGQGLQHELGVQHAAVCGVGSGRRGWRQPWVRGGRKGGVKAVDSAQLPPRPAECAPAATPLHGGDNDGCSSSCSENQANRCLCPSGEVPGCRMPVESPPSCGIRGRTRVWLSHLQADLGPGHLAACSRSSVSAAKTETLAPRAT